MQQEQVTVANTVQQYARPEVTADFTLDHGGSVKFRIIKWSPTKVFDRIPEYGTILAVPMIMYSTAEDFAGQDLEEKIGMALIQLFSGLEQRVLSQFLKDLLDETYTEAGLSVTDNFDDLFAKHTYLVIELAAKVLEVNYGPFFKRGFGKLLTQFKGIETLVKN